MDKKLLRDLAVKLGGEMTDRLFLIRGCHVEAHLNRNELTALLALAIERGYEIGKGRAHIKGF